MAALRQERSVKNGHSIEIRTYFIAIMFRSPLSDAAGGLAEDPPCLFALSACTIHDLGIRDCSSARKSPSNPNTFGPFAFGSRSHACGATLHSLIWR
jgi:hypothetical protein